MQTKVLFKDVKSSDFTLSAKRAAFYQISDIIKDAKYKVEDEDLVFYENIDLVYRMLCSILYNFVPMSGHPGGSISSGRIVSSLLFDTMDYDISDPEKKENDLIVYAAGHKALGLYSMWALRNELLRIADPKLLPEEKFQLRLEDLLGFRRNPTNDTPLFNKFNSKPLDGHPTPFVPFVKVATGPSGVGVGAAIGMGLSAMDTFREKPVIINILEGEGGMTPGRVAEAMAAAATAQLSNVIMHLDWNQASIDSNKVCSENNVPGDYVQWTPAELGYINDWNVIFVDDGFDFKKVLTAQNFAYHNKINKQPTLIVYRTIKGRKYGMEGKASHGAGHKFASDGYYETLKEFEEKFKVELPRFCADKPTPEAVEKCFHDTLLAIRKVLEGNPDIAKMALEKISFTKDRLNALDRKPHKDAGQVDKIYNYNPKSVPAELDLKEGQSITLREVLSKTLNHLNKESKGAILASAADLYGSTSVKFVGEGFAQGFYNADSNPESRLLAGGGICEDGIGAMMSGVSAFSRHIGVASSYAAFVAPLKHISARVHAIGQQAKHELTGKPHDTFIMINAHAGAKTGEDGPTHADPQPLQILQDNFPKGASITLTPWSPDEIWPLMIEALNKRPAVLCPFVSRPAEILINRSKLGLPEACAAIKGIYPIMKANKDQKPYHGTVVIQGNAVGSIFVNEVLSEIRELGLNMNAFYVTSMELFNMLDEEERNEIFPPRLAQEAMGMTDFTLPTMYYWVRNEEGLKRTIHSFKKGCYLGSGKADDVLKEAGMDAKSQIEAITEYAKFMSQSL